MKVGILTFHNSLNYGSVLQSFALQKYIESKFKCYVEIIDYVPKNKYVVNSIFETRHGFKGIVKNFIKLSLWWLYKTREKNFLLFQEKHLNISSTKYTDENINCISDKYDVLITGSDQIWNAGCLDFSWVYILHNIKAQKKIAYAPSIGSYIYDGKNKSIFQKCVEDYDFISIRENLGKKQISSILPNKEVVVVPDPTLLLSKEQYESSLVMKNISPSSKYMFLYMINMEYSYIELAIRISKKLGLKIFTVISSPESFRLLKYPCIKFLKNESPVDFINYVNNAELVLVNSFHGTVFSILFKKNFFALCDLSKDSRINTVLDNLDLKERAIDIQNFDETFLKKPINYDAVEKKLAKYSEIGKEFLKNSFSN